MENVSKILIEWYLDHKRDLPWRDTSDPYIIWVSEVILQQTRVAQGYDYFVRFISRFPNVTSLAEADEDEVLRYWQGLGYYSRARNMHVAARSMKGSFPYTYEGVRSLKGIGEYTAAAICSFAYNLPYAVVDGNVYRFLSRWLGITTPIDIPAGKKEFAEVAAQLLDKDRPGLHNQAVMEFGALQCTPSSPNCLFCPLNGNCVALKQGLVDKLPVKQHKTKIQNRYFCYIYVSMGSYTYINKRTGKDIWRNLFELPLIETDRSLSDEELIKHPIFQNMFVDKEEPIIRCVRKGIKHILTHRIIWADFYEVVLPEDSRSFNQFLKIKTSELDQYAFPRLIHSFLTSYGL